MIIDKANHLVVLGDEHVYKDPQALHPLVVV